MKPIEHNFILSPESCPRGGTLGYWGQKLEHGDLQWRPIDYAF